MFVAWIVFHVIVCIALILVVLMQSSKGEGLSGSAFGGGMSSAVFGGRGAATFLSRATTVLAIIFFLNCGVLAWMSAARAGGTVSTNVENTTTNESAVTRQAQAEQQRAAQRQQNQQGMPPEGGQQQPAGTAQPAGQPAGGTQPAGGAPQAPTGGTGK